MSRESNGRFGKGNNGRVPGSRNRLQGKFIDELANDFAEHGAGVIKIVRAEKPTEYLKIVASILPKELFVSDGAIDAMTEEEVVEALNNLRAMRAASQHAQTETEH
ncbi:hypothetical protein [Bradyrhizobium sp. G127]|uniref:hypothetical protein n=1 Tax=Bradyrhizobium sp. G127 TaxID=2904800 RepID=UPI001F216636|nr:hypothetical protein [Bradyrhizobium sp. G127]MCF2523914.1 hypothetical protein [Bradyrhizobium sp. G127]